MAKLSASEIAMVVTHQAIQIHDEMGYSQDILWSAIFRMPKALKFTKMRVNFSGWPSPDVNWD
jgi:alkylation response protein AidB-like acyl-CoA dehydrogenase